MQYKLFLTGKDGLDLLHRISTVNVQSLQLNHRIPALILNPQGKIECAFYLEKTAEDQATLDFEENPEATHQSKILSTLDHYTFAERYTIKPSSETRSTNQSELERIQNLEPKVGNEFQPDGTTNPLEIHFQSAIHDQKGCYPGQEVIEKIIAIGSPAKRLCQIKGPLLLENLPVPLLDLTTQSEVGMLTSAVKTADGMIGLAILRKTHAKENQSLTTPSQIPLTVEKVSS